MMPTPPTQPPMTPVGPAAPTPIPQAAPQPPAKPLTDPRIQRDMPDADLKMWLDEIARSRDLRKKAAQWWDENLKNYAPRIDQDPTLYGTNVNTNRDFTLVERKKADLFYQRPDVTALPSPRLADQPQLLETHTQILNEKLGPDGIDAGALADQVLFDILCTSGMGWSIMGYEAATVDTEMTVPDGEQAAPGSILGLSATPTFKTVTAPVPVYEECFWKWLSAKCGLVPVSVRVTDVDEWPWAGADLEIDLRTAIRKGWVDKDYKGTAPDREWRFQNGFDLGDANIVKVTLIYYKSALYRDDRVHPLHYTRLILVDDKVVDHVDCPYQTLDANGKLTPDSLIGNPIHPGTIRTLSDSPIIPSDCTISRPLINELNKGREQMIEQRESNIPRMAYNVGTVPPEAVNKMVKSPINGIIGLPEECFNEASFKELPQGQFPRENFEFNNIIDNDLARTHAIDADQSGAKQVGDQSATEAAIKQNNVNARLSKERNNFLKWYLRGVTKYSAILQRLLPVEDAADIVGPQAAQQWDSWRKTIPAPLAFTAMPDSALRTDLAFERKRAMDEYSFLAKAPGIDPVALTKELLPKIHWSSKVLMQQPPQPHPEPTRPTFAFKGEDLNPLAPQFPIIMEILRQCGVNVSPQAVQQAQGGAQNALMAEQATIAHDTGLGHPSAPPEHGGKLQQLENLSKHAAALTGAMPGTGGQTPIQPGPQAVQ